MGQFIFPIIGINSEKAMASHSSTLAWQIPWMEEPCRLQSMGSLRVGHNLATKQQQHCVHICHNFFIHSSVDGHLDCCHVEKAVATHSSTLAWRIPGTEEPDGLPSMGSHRVGHDWCHLAAAAAAAFPKLMKTNLCSNNKSSNKNRDGFYFCYLLPKP